MQEREGRVSLFSPHSPFYICITKGKESVEREVGREPAIVPLDVLQRCILWDRKRFRAKGEGVKESDSWRTRVRCRHRVEDKTELWITSSMFNDSEKDWEGNRIITFLCLYFGHLHMHFSVPQGDMWWRHNLWNIRDPSLRVGGSPTLPGCSLHVCLFHAFASIMFVLLHLCPSLDLLPPSSHLPRTCEHVSVRWWARVGVLNSSMHTRKRLDVGGRSSSFIAFGLSLKTESLMQNGTGGFAQFLHA